MKSPEMVIDTSVLMAVLKREAEWVRLRATILAHTMIVPAPVLVEFWRVARKDDIISPSLVSSFIAEMISKSDIVAFTADHANAAAVGGEAHGTGNGRGGLLNLFDLIVYGVAKVTGLPILCTGKDFASTDAVIHPASRIG